MIADKLRIEQLLKQYGSPLYVFREKDFIDNYHSFDNELFRITVIQLCNLFLKQCSQIWFHRTLNKSSTVQEV